MDSWNGKFKTLNVESKSSAKPEKKDFGYQDGGYEEETGWLIDGGEEAYLEALRAYLLTHPSDSNLILEIEELEQDLDTEYDFGLPF